MNKIKLIGVPSCYGALYSGTELAPEHFRKAGLIEALKNQFVVEDLGDIELPAILPKHNVPPVRNWPAPRMVWDTLFIQSQEWFLGSDLTIIIGGDCSIIVGTASAFYQIHNENTHILVLDAHVDYVRPRSGDCVGAAAMGLWFLLNENDFWNSPFNLIKNQLMILGCVENEVVSTKFSTVSLLEMKQSGVRAIVERYLSSIPETAKVLLHFDVDIISSLFMNAAYAPAEDGLGIEEIKQLLYFLLKDPRIAAIEITEFSALKDQNYTESKKIIDLLIEVLGARITCK